MDKEIPIEIVEVAGEVGVHELFQIYSREENYENNHKFEYSTKKCRLLKFIRSGICVNRHIYIPGYRRITIINKKYRAGVVIESIKG